MESAVGATLTYLTHPGILSPLETIRKLSTKPAQILRLDAGTLKPDETPVAQVCIIDPNLEWQFDRSMTYTKAKHTPFQGMRFKGKSLITINGSEIYRDAKFPSDRYTTS